MSDWLPRRASARRKSKVPEMVTSKSPKERWYTTDQAAALLGMTADAVRRAIRRGAIEAVKYGQWRIPRSSLERFWAFKCNKPGTLPDDQD
jgi:excisionase family DNA binding protein